MLELNLPQFEVKIKKTDKIYIWDIIRNKYLVLTPEEWVRQHFVNYMINEKGFPKTLIANEIQIKLNNQKRRCDTVIYNTNLSPEIIIEYKSPEVKITQNVFDQIVRYNIVLKVKYLIVSNGLEHYCCKIDYNTMNFEYLPEIPNYDTLDK